MLELALDRRSQSGCRVLCLGAHSDDIEIGCGGTLLKLLAAHQHAMVFYWIVLSAEDRRAAEAQRSANEFLAQVESKHIVIKNFKQSCFPYVGSQIKEYFEQLKREFSPDMIFTHFRSDLHQDHRVVSELTWNTFRNHLILEYEIPKYDGDLGSPNVFVHLDETLAQRKAAHLLHHFSSQREKHWFNKDTFLALLRLRGVESNASGKFAEAFYCRKMVLI